MNDWLAQWCDTERAKGYHERKFPLLEDALLFLQKEAKEGRAWFTSIISPNGDKSLISHGYLVGDTGNEW